MVPFLSVPIEARISALPAVSISVMGTHPFYIVIGH